MGTIAPRLQLEVIPKGIIEIFVGLLVNIPQGWRLCDGANGTPDLRERFVRGVASTITEPGMTGGLDDVTLTSSEIGPHNHTVTAYSHSHQFTGATTVGTGGIRRTTTGIETDTKVTTSNSPPNQNLIANGGGGSHENKPPFFQIAYIMKIF